MPSRARILPEPPPTVAPMPDWARVERHENPFEGPIFLAGAALAALHPAARHDHPIGGLWRQRLALKAAAAVAGVVGRREDESGLRDAHYLTKAGDDPGPAGKLLRVYRAIGDPHRLASDEWAEDVLDLLDLRDSAEAGQLFREIGRAMSQTAGPVQAAARAAAACLSLGATGRILAPWVADMLLAQRLRWRAPIPLLAIGLRSGDWRSAREGRTDLWEDCCALAYARAAATALDLHADLGRRAMQLLEATPKLRGKEASAIVERLLAEDAQSASAGRMTSDRSARRLFERLVELGVARELTGRPTFRLYGL